MLDHLRSSSAQIRSWFRALTHRNRLEANIDAELADHLARLTADLVAVGHSQAEAARRARIAMGSMLVTKENVRASVGLRWWDEVRADLRLGVRLLLKSPAFTAVSLISLALALGANTTVFSAAKFVLYRQLGVAHPEQLRLVQWRGDQHVSVHMMWGESGSDGSGHTVSPEFSYPVYELLRGGNQSMQDLFAFKQDQMNATVRGNAQRLPVEMVTGNYFAQLGVGPQLGRQIQLADETTDANGAVAVISDSLWAREFGRSPSAVGQSIKVNDVLLTIIGVNPRGFTGAQSALSSPHVFVPITLQPRLRPIGAISNSTQGRGLLSDNDLWWVEVMGRLKPGISEERASVELDTLLAAAVRATSKLQPGDTLPRMNLVPGARGLHGSDWMFRQPLHLLMGMAGLVLLLACVNIANLLLARGAQRQREMSVRLAIGAGRARLMRQGLTESLLLAALGGAGGLVLGYFGRNVAPALLDNGWRGSEMNVPFDWKVFLFAAAVTMLTGFLFGLAPAWIASRSEVSTSLKRSAHTATRRRQNLGGKAIVAVQVALSAVLLVGAGLFLRTLFTLNETRVGFNPDHLLLVDVNLPQARYPAERDVQLFARVEQQFASIHGVEQVSPMQEPYLAGIMSNMGFLPEGEKSEHGKNQAEFINVVGTDFFKTLEIPILAGRGFGPQDTATSQKVAVINQTLARTRFPGVSPFGKRFRVESNGDDWIQIVGICGDTHYDQLKGDPPGQFLIPYVQHKDVRGMTFVLRTRMSPADLAHPLRRLMAREDPDVPLVNIRTQRQQIDDMIHQERSFAYLTSGFGVLAVMLACVGIYGVMACAVAQRTNEIGIRMAMGALPKQVRAMVLRESAWMTAAGLAAGVGVSLAAAQLVRSMLYGVQSYDPATMAGAALVLAAVALLSTWIPAQRAAKIQPMDALRHE
jgi:predicted permease